ncbi:helix-turn-helix domain-containing protein [Paraburkholderia phosphatilytica]|uniref:helix-turn-helix domain-containing protein n=1 Tax=Paraburkholderia phosphatilytica TaxID=2282883 RepID=UPI000E49775D|nr:helix-turn-helix domain-containing protein [Paraburkholderia phosphatilytica]
MRQLCMPRGLANETLPRLESVICIARPVTRGEALYRGGDPFRYLYAIRTGAIKTVMTQRDGREQVTGLRIAGEPLGLDGLGSNAHTCSAIALEDSSVCIVPYAPLLELCRDIDTMQARLLALAGEHIARVEAQMMVNDSMSADERVARFLLDLSERNAQRGYSATEFSLRMTREELGSHLGVTLETVSRTLSGFQRRRLIELRGKAVRLVCAEALRAV